MGGAETAPEGGCREGGKSGGNELVDCANSDTPGTDQKSITARSHPCRAQRTSAKQGKKKRDDGIRPRRVEVPWGDFEFRRAPVYVKRPKNRLGLCLLCIARLAAVSPPSGEAGGGKMRPSSRGERHPYKLGWADRTATKNGIQNCRRGHGISKVCRKERDAMPAEFGQKSEEKGEVGGRKGPCQRLPRPNGKASKKTPGTRTSAQNEILTLDYWKRDISRTKPTQPHLLEWLTGEKGSPSRRYKDNSS